VKWWLVVAVLAGCSSQPDETPTIDLCKRHEVFQACISAKLTERHPHPIEVAINYCEDRAVVESIRKNYLVSAKCKERRYE
jgi:hypothetical protein